MDKFLQIALERITECKKNDYRHLDLSYLYLSRIPKEVFELKNLYSLDLQGNNLFEIPDEIEGLSNLKELDISSNFLELFGVSALRHLKSLQELVCSSNPFLKDIPVEIINRSASHLIEYISYLNRSPTTRLRECKLIFVGYGEVGKTTLMKKIMNPKYHVYVGNEPTTHGINIEKWLMLPDFDKLNASDDYDNGNDIDDDDNNLSYSYEDYDYDDEEEDDIDVSRYYARGDEEKFYVDINLWDFGGQEIYHATHQFFLTKRSVYIFVWEARKEEDYFQFEYWLNIIKYLSDSSPVIIVMNKCEVRDKNIDEDTLRQKYPNIQGFLKVSCVDNLGLDKLRSIIEKSVMSLAHINDLMPRTWKRIRYNLESIDEDYISVEEYYKICKSFVLDKKQADALSEYYHDLGVILHFSKDSLLKKTVILNPDWATEAVYNLIDSGHVIDGRFNYSDLEYIWDLQKYPTNKHLELIRLMEKFELVFNLNGTTDYIIPELLGPKKPTFEYNKFKHYKLRIEFRYDFMPAGIVSRLICRLHHLIPQKLYWKDGVIIEYENSEALIMSERINRKLLITINGSDAGNILSIIRHELSILHNSLNLEKEKDYKEMVPCNCRECQKSKEPHFYSYSTLKKFLSKGKQVMFCEVSTDDVSIMSLLNGYEIQPRDNDLVHYVLNACSKLQGHHSIIDAKEDSRNEFIASVLDARYIAKDQARWGKSESGKSEGELDIKIVNDQKLPISVFEAFTLTYFSKGVIKSHLEKMANYDPNGFRENYIIIYNENKDFINMWERYLNFICEINFKHRMVEAPIDISDRFPYTEIKIGITIHERNNEKVKLYHIFLNLSS